MTAKTVKEVLAAARWMLENVGWCQGEFAKSQDKTVWMGRYTTLEEAVQGAGVETVDCFCSLGAINAVEADSSIKRLAEENLSTAIGGSILRWNDNPKRTKKEVLKSFDKAIKGAK